MSEEETCERLDFGSVEAMHLQLSHWGVPPWLAGSGKPEQEPKRRNPHGSSQARTLPSPENAANLFKEVLDNLGRAVEGLRRLKMSHKDGRFVSSEVYNDPVVLFRELYPEDEWRRICESNGKDPERDRILLHGATTRDPLDSSNVPPRPLVTLVGTYALADGNMGDLLKALHPEPLEADAKEISTLIYGTKREHGRDGLLRTAEQLAAAVCNRKLGRGAPPPALPAREHNAACHITHRCGQGWTYDKIHGELRALGFTRADVERLGAMRLNWEASES